MATIEAIAEAISDMKFQFGVETDRDLAVSLGIDPTAISAWRKRKKIPDKYLVRFARLRDEFAHDRSVAPPGFNKLLNAYLFALIRETALQLDATVKLLRDEEFVDLWTGFRLHRFYEHALKELRSCPPGDKDDLRRVYQELRTKIAAADLYEWIETLPDPA